MLATKPLWDTDLSRGYRLNQMVLLERIGYGGEGVVWSAWDNRRQSIVAVKLIPTMRAGENMGHMWEEFERQVHLVASLEHPNILPLYEFGATNEFFFFVMQYNGMGSLTNRLLLGSLPLEKVLHITAQVVAALTYLHSRGIIYRDLKPSNILLDSQDRVYLSDFGLARRLSFETRVHHTGRGTGPYAPQEQHSHQNLVPQSDIYSLGVVLYELLTGSLPWDGQRLLALQQMQQGEPLPDPRAVNPALPSELTAVLRQMTAQHWQHRPETAVAAFNLLLAACDQDKNWESYMALATSPTASASFILDDARHFLEKHTAHWNAELEEFPLRLTHFALIDAATTKAGGPQLTLHEQQKAFMLHGALVYDYRVEHWWQQVANPATRLAVCEQIILQGNEPAVLLALNLLQGDPAILSTAIDLSQNAVEQLLDLAVSKNNWVLRNQVLTVLEHNRFRVKRWQKEGISWLADARLAHLAAGDSTQARHAARIIGLIRSETAVQALLNLAETNGQAWLQETLQAIWGEAASLPDCVPQQQRLRVRFNRLAARFTEDKGGLSLSRVVVGLMVALVMATFMSLGLFNRADAQTRDTLFAPYPTSGIVTIVAVDDASLAQYGRWDTWSRTLHAQLIDQLASAGAQAIVFDIIFDTSTPEDATLIAAMQQAGNIIQPVLAQGDAFLDVPGMVRFAGHILPETSIRAAAAALGHTNILHESDGYVREMPSIIAVGDERYPNLAMAAVQVFLTGQIPAGGLPQPEKQQLDFAGRQIPVGEFGEIRIYYAGPPATAEKQTFPQVSYHDVLAGNVPTALLQNKIVLVGITATAEPDRYLTPVSEGRPMYGVEIIANLIESIWSAHFITRPGQWLLILVLFVLGALTSLVSYRPWAGLAFTVGLGVSYYLLAVVLFDTWAIMLDIFYPFATIAFTFTAVVTYRLSAEARLRREVLRLFASNVTPDVAEAALEAVRRGDLNLGGQVKELTVLFVDIRGHGRFTGMYEPSQVVALMNRFRAMVIKAAMQFDGTIAHTESEQIMIIFNAPLPQPDHARRAVETAVTLRTQIATYTQTLTDDDPEKEVGFGCGIYTGRAIVGSFGESHRAVYTAFGDTVSIASQLATSAKMGQILIGDAGYQQVKGETAVAELPPLLLRERSMPLLIYAIERLSLEPG